ncbi:MAG: glycosyltransferase family 9 protein [Elusimicrobia bacterium]|nr:glycosyltransferase family 9 protein [Elusimicrobiota bacterium]
MQYDLAEARGVTALLIGRLGDMIVASPMLRALRRAAPEARLRLVASAASRQAAAMIPGVDEVVLIHPYWKPAGNCRAAAALRARPCDLLVDLNPSPSRTSAALAALARSPVKAAFSKGRFDFLYTDRAEAPAEREHMLDRYARLARLLNLDYEPRLEVRLKPEDERSAEAVAAGWDRPAGLRLLVHAGNFKKFDNRWPEDKFAELCGGLQGNLGIDLVFLAGPGEAGPVAALASRLKRPAPVAGPFPAAVTAALLKRADALLCNITGTTHLAAAVGTPTFGLYSGYTHAVWRPRDPGHDGVVSGDWESCRGIPVEAARARLEGFLARLQARA